MLRVHNKVLFFPHLVPLAFSALPSQNRTCVRCACLRHTRHKWSSHPYSSRHPGVCRDANTMCSLMCLRCSGLSSAGIRETPLFSSCSNLSRCLSPPEPELYSWSNKVWREKAACIQGSWSSPAPLPSVHRCSPGRSCVHKGWLQDSSEGSCISDKRGGLCWQECEALPCLWEATKGGLYYTTMVSFPAKMTQLRVVYDWTFSKWQRVWLKYLNVTKALQQSAEAFTKQLFFVFFRWLLKAIGCIRGIREKGGEYRYKSHFLDPYLGFFSLLLYNYLMIYCGIWKLIIPRSLSNMFILGVKNLQATVYDCANKK